MDEGDPNDRNAKADDANSTPQTRVQHRLARSQGLDRDFLRALRQKRRQPSQLGTRLKSERIQKRWWRGSLFAVVTTLGLSSSGWAVLFVEGTVTYKGVPYLVVRKFWQDEAAKTAYFSGDRQALHDRLSLLGIEQDIKRYYRGQFENEYALDRHIHQIMFDRTGYIGEAYRVDRHGRIISR